MPVFDSNGLKSVLHSIERPEELNNHPWTKLSIVQARVAESPVLRARAPGEQLLRALLAEFQSASPAPLGNRRGRLHTQWVQYGLLAARYFAPLAERRSPPPSLADSWPMLNAALRALGFHALPAEESEELPLSTLSDYHTRGLTAFAMHLNARESQLAAGTQRPLWVPVMVVFILLLTALFAWKGMRIAQAVTTVRLAAADLNVLSEMEADQLDPELVLDHINEVQNGLVQLEQELRPLFPVLQHMNWVPQYGATLASTPDILAYATHSLAGLEAFTNGARPLLAAYRTNQSHIPIDAILGFVHEGQELARLAQAELDQARSARTQFAPEGFLPTEVADAVRRLDTINSYLGDGLAIQRSVPLLLGAGEHGPQTYLVLMQNEDELRATGGFVTGLGLITVQNGSILAFRFEDSPAVDNPELPYNRLPWQMVDYMDGGIWLMRDVNWSPDFPEVARLTEWLYAYSRLHSVDGVIAVNQVAVARLLAVLGPVEAAGLQVDSQNLIRLIREQKYAFQDEYGSAQRKDFLGVLAEAMLEKIQQGDELPIREVLQTTYALIREKHVLIQLDAPEVTALLERHQLDGAIRRPDTGDYLMVVEANLGFNKVNAATTTQLAYTVDLRQPDAPSAEIRAVLSNLNQRDIACHQIQPLDGVGYQPLIEQCYWAYLRVFTRPGTELKAFIAHAVRPEWLLTGLSVPPRMDLLELVDGGHGYGTMVVVPANESREVVLEYLLPENTLEKSESGWRYTLRIQKQPGTQRLLHLRILLPSTAKVQSTTHALRPAAPGEWELEIDLLTDVEIRLVFQSD